MMRALLRLAPCALVLLLGTAGARGATLYVTRVMSADPGDVSLGDLLHASGDVPAEAQEALARSIAVMGDKVLYVPTAAYMEQVKDAFGADSILVGSRSLIVPRGGTVDGETYILERLADYLEAQGLVGSSVVELALTQNVLRGPPPHDGEPVFQLLRNAKGSADVSFSLSGGGSSISGRVRVSGAGSSVGAGFASGSAVQVLFHKGPITIETPGKVLAAASPGDTVSVLLSDSQKMVVGKVLDGKAVAVDLP